MSSSSPPIDPDFPYSLTISLPLPSHRLASSALRALQVDTELSPLVRRTFRLTKPEHPSSSPSSAPSQIPDPALPSNSTSTPTTTTTTTEQVQPDSNTGTSNTNTYTDGERIDEGDEEELKVLETVYKAATNRMLRVAVNAYMDCLGLVIEVMQELDVDVLNTELGR